MSLSVERHACFYEVALNVEHKPLKKELYIYSPKGLLGTPY